MSLSDRNELFRQSGPRGMLDYLQSRLSAGDLSSEEALALLGALHEELGQMAAADPHIYQAYSRFMDSLQAAMPDVYDYVLSTWGHQRGKNEEQTAAGIEDGEAVSKESRPESKEGIAQVKIGELEGGGEREGFVEAEQVDAEKEVGEAAKEEAKEEAEEPEEGQEEKGEDEEEEQEEKAEGKEAEEVEENEGTLEESASGERGQEAQEETGKPETEADESEAGQEAGTDSEAEQAEAKSESVEAEAGTEAGEHQEAEWPQFEEPGPEEPIDGEEAGPAVD